MRAHHPLRLPPRDGAQQVRSSVSSLLGPDWRLSRALLTSAFRGGFEIADISSRGWASYLVLVVSNTSPSNACEPGESSHHQDPAHSEPGIFLMQAACMPHLHEVVC